MTDVRHRYRVDGVRGSMKGRLEVGGHILEKQYMGKQHDWNIYDMKTGEEIGGWSGTHVGGWCERCGVFDERPSKHECGSGAQ